MEQAKYPSATIRYNENLFSIEYFKTYPNEVERGNPYNTTFSIRVVSGAFCGYASCEYDIKEFSRFVNEMEEIYSFKRSKAEINDICYGSKVVFEADKIGHLEISGEIFGEAAEQSLVFRFEVDQTCLKNFIQTIKMYIEQDLLCGEIQMIKELMHDPIFLAGKSEVATKEDLQVAQDLLDTLMAHSESCVGMAANMIGVRKRIIAFLDESGRVPTYTVMLNPEIVAKSGIYETEEGCLSLLGGSRKCKRYKTIKVRFQTLEMKTHTKNFNGWTAQIIQHEIDHCNGVLI